MEKTLSIEGMSCGHCVNSVEKALKAVPGVTKVSVDLASRQAVVDAEAAVSDDTLKSAVVDAGYQVVSIR